jgi:hypothetical protein
MEAQKVTARSASFKLISVGHQGSEMQSGGAHAVRGFAAEINEGHHKGAAIVLELRARQKLSVLLTRVKIFEKKSMWAWWSVQEWTE